jgi:hypothetical protein
VAVVGPGVVIPDRGFHYLQLGVDAYLWVLPELIY